MKRQKKVLGPLKYRTCEDCEREILSRDPLCPRCDKMKPTKSARSTGKRGKPNLDVQEGNSEEYF